jgi:hypothetical protein
MKNNTLALMEVSTRALPEADPDREHTPASFAAALAPTIGLALLWCQAGTNPRLFALRSERCLRFSAHIGHALRGRGGGRRQARRCACPAYESVGLTALGNVDVAVCYAR